MVDKATTTMAMTMTTTTTYDDKIKSNKELT